MTQGRPSSAHCRHPPPGKLLSLTQPLQLSGRRAWDVPPATPQLGLQAWPPPLQERGHSQVRGDCSDHRRPTPPPHTRLTRSYCFRMSGQTAMRLVWAQSCSPGHSPCAGNTGLERGWSCLQGHFARSRVIAQHPAGHRGCQHRTARFQGPPPAKRREVGAEAPGPSMPERSHTGPPPRLSVLRQQPGRRTRDDRGHRHTSSSGQRGASAAGGTDGSMWTGGLLPAGLRAPCRVCHVLLPPAAPRAQRFQWGVDDTPARSPAARGALDLPERRPGARDTGSGTHAGPGRLPGRGLCFASRRRAAPAEDVPDARRLARGPTQGREPLREGRRRITRKKWAVMSCVRAPPWEPKFLCRTVQASEEGTDRAGTRGPLPVHGPSCAETLAARTAAPLTTVPDCPCLPPHCPTLFLTVRAFLWAHSGWPFPAALTPPQHRFHGHLGSPRKTTFAMCVPKTGYRSRGPAGPLPEGARCTWCAGSDTSPTPPVRSRPLTQAPAQ